jgi:NitT/TauT family transport system ATP-binding protein
VTEPQPAALEFIDVAKVFPDGTDALQKVSTRVSPGDFVAVIGPSGCGKSTLLRLASGLDAATRGVVRLQDKNVGYVFQDANLLPWRTVWKNVELLPQLHRMPREMRDELVRREIELVGLEGFEQHYPKSLSGGMRMRVSLARALTLKPSLFLFDEPFGALDEINRTRLNDELLKLFVDQQFAAVFVTHSIAEAVYLSSRILVMSPRPGRVVADVNVPFDYPRSKNLRFTPEFSEIAGLISKELELSTSSSERPVPGVSPDEPPE